MFNPIRAVSPRSQARCPSCHCFVRLDAGTCSACGVVFALASGFNNSNLSAFSNIQPDGKIKRTVHPGQKKYIRQLDLFGGVL